VLKVFNKEGLRGVITRGLSGEKTIYYSDIIREAHMKSTAPTGGGGADELIKLKSLLDSGVLTKAEFESEKQKVLAK
jgi:hypothetical protein